MVGTEVKIFDFYKSSDRWGIHFQHIYTKPHRTRLDIQLYIDIKSPNIFTLTLIIRFRYIKEKYICQRFLPPIFGGREVFGLTFKAPATQNGQTHSNNSSATADELFQCV